MTNLIVQIKDLSNNVQEILRTHSTRILRYDIITDHYLNDNNEIVVVQAKRAIQNHKNVVIIEETTNPKDYSWVVEDKCVIALIDLSIEASKKMECSPTGEHPEVAAMRELASNNTIIKNFSKIKTEDYIYEPRVRKKSFKGSSTIRKWEEPDDDEIISDNSLQ